MPISPLETAGAAIQPTSAAPLHTNEFFTGLWTNGSPLGPGAVPFLYQRFYSAMRYDRLIAGANVEVSTRLTLMRRPGSSVYNSSLFPPINRFYEWRGFDSSGERIRIMASCDSASGSAGGGTVRDVTGPSTNLILQTKAANAGRTSFVGVGNHLYWGDGVETGMAVQFQQQWTASTQYNPGDMIVDSNGNVQMAMGSQTASIINVEVDSYALPARSGKKVTLWFDSSTPLEIRNGISLTLAGMTTVPSLNGATPYTANVIGNQQVYFTGIFVGVPATPYSNETGTATTGTGISGATEPAWSTTSSVTPDGGNQWVMVGSAVRSWGLYAPTIAPTVTQTAAPTIYPAWQPNTWYAPPPSFIILDSNGNLQQLTGPLTGVIKTANSAPAWATAVGAVTTETTSGANAQWTCQGPAAWAASAPYALNAAIVVSYTYAITVPVVTYNYDPVTHSNVPTVTYQQQQISVTSLFQCIAAGTSGANPPSWTNGIGTTTKDGTVTWQNAGNAPAWPASSNLSLASKVLDSNNNIEVVQTTGESGATAPAWNTAGLGSTTTDNTTSWRNAGVYSAAGTAAWIWAYSGKDSVTGAISSMSPQSVPLTPSAGEVPVIQGPGLANPPYDTIVLWRTAAGGSTFMYEDEFPNPGPGQSWIYTDTIADPSSATSSQQGELNPLILAPVGVNNNPPPANFVPICYYMNRIWGFAGNILMGSNGPDQGAEAGSGDMGFGGLNQFTLPSLGTMLWPTSVGLIVFTNSDIWAVLGQGTYQADGSPVSPFYVVTFQEGIGLLSQDAFTVNGSTAYLMIGSHQVLSIDPGAGEVEVGFPIGDQFDDNYDPVQAYLAWHQGRSKDTALYVADGAAAWYRMAAVAAPESGNVWSTQSVIAAPGQVKAIKSVEQTPGQKILLIGPSVNNQPILYRDLSTNADNGALYGTTHATISSVVLAQPGTTAGLQFVVVEEKMITGSNPLTVSLLFDEILGQGGITLANFRPLRNSSSDPPTLAWPKSIRTRRWWGEQDPATVIKCRHYQQDLLWAAENHPNELYTNTVYGRLPEKARK